MPDRTPRPTSWVKFVGNFSFKPTPQTTIDYPAGMVCQVTSRCAEKAIAAGKAEQLARPPK